MLENKKCNERLEKVQQYYLANVIGILMIATGVIMWDKDGHSKLGSGFSIAIGTPMMALGFAGMLKIWEW